MMQSYLCGVHTTQTPITSCHISHTQQEHNANHKNIMLTWFASYVNPNDVKSGKHDTCKCIWQILPRNSGNPYVTDMASMHASQAVTRKNNHVT